MRIATTLRSFLIQTCTLLLHPDPPDLATLPWAARQRINAQSLAAFCCSAAGARWALWLVVWQLAAQLLAWEFDLGLRTRTWLGWSAAVWAWPCLLYARRQQLESLLQQRRAVD